LRYVLSIRLIQHLQLKSLFPFLLNFLSALAKHSSKPVLWFLFSLIQAIKSFYLFQYIFVYVDKVILLLLSFFRLLLLNVLYHGRDTVLLDSVNDVIKKPLVWPVSLRPIWEILVNFLIILNHLKDLHYFKFCFHRNTFYKIYFTYLISLFSFLQYC